MNDLTPKVSIITVCYNSVKTLERTIQSVINQTYFNIEYIIIDGGSVDGTLNIIKKYENKIAYWVCENDKGVYDAMNKGIKMATGEIIGIINSDDWYALDAVEISVKELMNNHEYDAVCGDVLIYSNYGNNQLCKRSSSIPQLEVLQYTMSILHPTVFARKNFYYKFGMFNLDFKIAADYDLFLRSTQNGAFVKSFSHLIANFQMGGLSSNQIMTKKELFMIRKKNNISLMIRFISAIVDVFQICYSFLCNFIPLPLLLFIKTKRGWTPVDR